MSKNTSETYLTFHGVVYAGKPIQMAIDGVGGAMEVDGSIEKGATDAVTLSLECTLEADGLDGLPELNSASDYRAEYGPDGHGAEDEVIGYTKTRARISEDGKIVSVSSSYEALPKTS